MKTKTDESMKVICRRVAPHIAPYRALLLAFSGGLDSTVLLDTLVALRDGHEALNGAVAPLLRAIHIHHGLSRRADCWAEHCANACRLYDVSFSTVRVRLKVTPGGIEAAARDARYRALATALVGDEILVTAQHQDDQAETLLLALKRGSGPAGLAGMAVDAPFFDGRRLLRPLLDCARSEIEAYARSRGLRWIEDESNANPRFDRNFLRLQILQPQRKRWPQFAAATARSAQLCAEQERLLDELLAETLDKLTHIDGSLSLMDLKAMSDIRRAALLRRWLAGRGLRMPSRRQLTRLWQEVALSRRDAVAHIYLDDRQVRRFRDRLYIVPCFPRLPDDGVILDWPPKHGRLILPAGIGTLLLHVGAITGTTVGDSGDTASLASVVRAPMAYERVSVRFGSAQGLLYITGRRHGRRLKKIWQELNIPPWRRRRTPLLFYNEQLIAALGVFVTWGGEPGDTGAQWHIFLSNNSKDSISVIWKGGLQESVLPDADSRNNKR